MSDIHTAGESEDPASTQDRSSVSENTLISPRGHLISDKNGVILQADYGASVLLCVTVQELIGCPLSSCFAIDQKETIEYLRQGALELHGAVHGMFVLPCSGSQKAQQIAVSVIAAVDENQVVALSWVFDEMPAHTWTDVSEVALKLAQANQHLKIELAERQKAEAAAAKRERELSALHRATTALLSTLDLQVLLGQIVDAATSAIGVAEKGMLHLIAPDTGQLEMRAAIGYQDPRIQKINFPERGGYVARAVQARRPLLICDTRREPDARDGRPAEAGLISSVIVAPLIHPTGQVLGALSLEALEARVFNEDDLRLLVSFAATATTAIYNAQLHAEVQKLAITDALTGLYNRRGFEELGKRELERLRRFGHPLSAMMVDVDFFKKVNDAYGHKVGDQVIRAVAKRLIASLREVDIIGRFGGDEFTVLLPETDLFTAVSAAERTLINVRELPIVADELALNLTVSIGVVKATAETPSLDALLEQADQAMYAAKQAGRNQVQIR